MYVKIGAVKLTLNPRLFRSEPMQRCQLAECRAACCLYGVWISLVEWDTILENADQIQKFMPAEWVDSSCWSESEEENDPFVPGGRVRHSRVVNAPDHYGGTACVFLRGDHKCALQVAGEDASYHPWHFKPFYCVLHPLDLDEEGRITLDSADELLKEAGSCLRACERKIPLLKTFEPELRYLLGDEEYEQLRSIRNGAPRQVRG